jgi:prephenate dehydrogenase
MQNCNQTKKEIRKMKAAVFGLGLIGGSFALSLREHGFADEVLGVEISPDNARKALELGLADRVVTSDEAVAEAELIVLATPVDVTPILATKILNKVTERQTVMDMGSIKQELCEVIEQHPKRGRFVATHPMWGTEFSGPEAARRDGFTGRTTVICDREKSDEDALSLVESIYTALGSPIIYMSGEEQDTHTAYVSHISHITSFALALTVLEKERDDDRIFDLAGGGFESTVRLAKSSPDTWLPIFMGNKYNVLDVLREHIHQLQVLRRMLEKDDTQGLREAMKKANTIKRILP